jgi:glycosyltransferase involved in cell wall biosynthesis
LIRAFARVAAAHLILVGDGPLRPEIESLVKNIGIKDRVHFLGKRSDVPQIIKMADVYVQSSQWEGFGIAALEAMAGGLPVVASRVPGLSEVVGDAGLLFKPGDSFELASMLNRLLNDDICRKKIMEKCVSRAQLFGIENTVEGYVSIYYQISKVVSKPKDKFN